MTSATLHIVRPVIGLTPGLPVVVVAFLASMIVPADLAFEVYGLRLDPQRLVLLAASFGILAWALRTWNLRLHDLLIIGAALWAAMTTFIHMAPGAAVERGGSFALETAIAYLLPSAYLTTAVQIRKMIRGFFLIVAALAVLAGMEAVIAEHVIANWAAEVMNKPEPFMAEERLGLLRARVSFSHQILLGIFCASLFAFFWFEATTHVSRGIRTVICGSAVFFSLSSAAFLLFGLQAAMIWIEAATRHFKNRARHFMTVGAASWIAIELSVQGGITGFVTRYLSLNPSTAYYRQLIWQHVTDDISANLLVGTGGFWTRPFWMVSSIDQFYFAKALKYGAVPVVLIVISVALIVRNLWRHPAKPGTAHWCIRFGWFFCILGLAGAGLTVDYFGRSLPFVMFIIGIGAAWLRIIERPDVRQALP